MEVSRAALPKTNPPTRSPHQTGNRLACLDQGPPHLSGLQKSVCGGLLFIGLLLVVILVPLSLSNVEYYEYGLVRQRSSGKMLLEKGVYDAGRYSLGPDRTFKKFRADAHYHTLDELSVFSGGKLETELDIQIIYFLRRDQLIELHNTFDRNYRPVVEGQIIGAIKNKTPSFPTVDFFQKRQTIEKILFEAVRNATDSVFVDITSLLLLRVDIPDEIVERQLNVATQLEENEKEEFFQKSKLIRQNTSFFVNEIENKANIITERAKSSAKLLIEKAEADAAFLVEEARFKGLSLIFEALNVTTAKDKATLDFLKAIEANEKAGLFFNFKTMVATSTPVPVPDQTTE